MVATMMIIMPTGSLDLQLKHDLGEFFSQHQNNTYAAYTDHHSDDFVCEMDQETMLMFILQHPRYQRYVKT